MSLCVMTQYCVVDGTGFAGDRGQARSYRDRATFQVLSRTVAHTAHPAIAQQPL